MRMARNGRKALYYLAFVAVLAYLWYHQHSVTVLAPELAHLKSEDHVKKLKELTTVLTTWVKKQNLLSEGDRDRNLDQRATKMLALGNRKEYEDVKGISSSSSATTKNNCRRWRTDWNAIERLQPAITLDPERYLYPLLVNGPNNQLIGLRDSVYLAIRLNRTFILPRFYKHKTDTTVTKGTSAAIPPSQRIDVAALASLVKVSPHSAVQSICSHGFDDLYFTSFKDMHSSLTHIVEDVGVPIHTKSTGEAADAYPIDPDPRFNALFHVRSSKKSLRKFYDSPGKCALYVGPYRTVGVKESTPMLRTTLKKYFTSDGSLLPTNLDADSTPDQELYCIIVHSTPKPKPVSAIVNEFMINFSLGEMSYASVHWRYDMNDWQVRCRKKNQRKESVLEMCRKIEHIEPIDIAGAILRFIRELERKISSRIQALYFAAPLNMEKFVESVEMEMSSVLEEEGATEELHVFTHSDLRDHLLKYESCEGVKENYEDIFSQLEMDVCSRATAFLRSPGSSWSKIVAQRRVISLMDEYDGNIFELSWNVAEGRLNE